MEQLLYGSLPHVHMVPPHVKCLLVLNDSYGPHTLYGIVLYDPPHVHMVPLTLYGTAIILMLLYIWSPLMKCHPVLNDSYGPHTLYRIGIIWSPTCMYGPPMYYMTLMVPYTLHKIGT